MITTTRIDRTQRARHETPLQLPALDGPVATTPTLPLLQDAWSRAIARVIASRRGAFTSRSDGRRIRVRESRGRCDRKPDTR